MSKILINENADNEKINGVKLLIFAYEREDGQKMFVVGPILITMEHMLNKIIFISYHFIGNRIIISGKGK